jgi:SAM-dependent methyltransferase
MDRDAGDAGYRGLAADLYDQLRGEAPLRNEFDFYSRWLEDHPGPALEVGCGTGRILLKLLAAGFDVEGMDASDDMLRLCRDKARERDLAPILYRQLMQRMDIARSYVTIFVPFASFTLLTGLDDARQALERFFHHLRPGGELLFSTYRPHDGASERSEWIPCGSVFHPARGFVRVSIASAVDRDARVATDYHRFEVMDGDAVAETVVHSIRQRWYQRDEMTGMLEAAGFHNIRVWGDHSDREVTPDHRVLVFGGTRPSP